MLIHRRNLLRSAGAAGLVSLAGRPPQLLARALARGAADVDRVLVLVQLAGGNDGLNTVIPHGDDAYVRARPGVHVPPDSVLKIDDYVGLHPQMTGFQALYDAGDLAIVQGVGYPQPDRSHFRSTDIWHSAQPEVATPRDGWLGRGLDEAAGEAESAGALALGVERLPLALVGAKVNVPVIRDLDSFAMQFGPGPESLRQRRRAAIERFAADANGDGSDLDYIGRTLRSAMTAADQLQAVKTSYRPAAEYPGTQLAEQLKLAAQLIAGEFGVRILFVSLGGFDTHSQQQGAHQALLGELSGAVSAFFADLAGHSLADRVLLATYSEFGRRVAENGSLGTDHGAASQLFVAGPAVRGGLHGDHPSLTDLDQGDLKFHTDFRRAYATILDRWLDLPSEAALGGRFEPVEFV